MAQRLYKILFPLSFVLAWALRFFLGDGLNTILQFIPLRCPLFFLFDLRCPTCGLGHALVHAWLGEWQESWVAHPLGLLLLAFGLWWWVSLMVGRGEKVLWNAWLWLSERQVMSGVLVGGYCVWGFCLRG